MKTFTLVAVLCLASLNAALPAVWDVRSGVSHVPSMTASSLSDHSILPRNETCYMTCGSVCYYEGTIKNATSAGYSLYKDGNTKGDYPHTYNNYEGLDFPVTGPYQEYPVMDDFKAYDGGSPGADRVIFNTKGSYAGTVTHTGASGNNFVACK